MWRPLYWFGKGVSPVMVPSMSLAYPPVYSHGDKTVTVRLKTSYRWSDGQPITSKDALFYIDEVKAAVAQSGANWGYYTPHIGIPGQVVSASTPNSTTLVLNLNKPVNPQWFTADELYYIQPMPVHAWAKASANGSVLDFTNPANAKKIYDFLAKESSSTGTYATNPLWRVVDGPYRLTAFNNTTGGYTLAPNPSYGGPHSAKVPAVQAIPYTSDTAEFNAVLSKGIDIGYMPLNDVPQLAAVEAAGYHVFGYPGWQFADATYNFADKTGDFNNIINQLYIRQALAHLENEPGYIKAFFHGAGGLAYGPVPSVPTSPYTPPNALKNPYPYGVAAAASLLKSHGWTVVPGGVSTCAKPGTGAGKCGAGIPARTKLAFNVLYASDPVVLGEQLTAWASDAKKVGINITLQGGTFNHVITVANDPGSPKSINQWAVAAVGGFYLPNYPTTLGIFSTGGSLNGGFYSNPQADRLIAASVTSGNPNAVKAEASYLTQVQPSLFQPNYDFIAVWKDNVSGQPAAIEGMTQYGLNTELMYLTH
jgi:peptide/nickel transport system substrate-binding protein